MDAERHNGERQFVEDLYPEGLHHAVLVRAPVARGRLRGIDVPKLGHGYMIIRAADIPGQNFMEGYGDDPQILVAEDIRYIGEPVAIVAGPDKNIVEQTAAECLVRVDPLPAEYSYEKFSSDRLAAKRTAVFGDPDSAFANADLVVEGVYRTGRQEHWYAEPQGALASFAYDKMEVYTATQWPFHVRSTVAAVLDVRDDDIVVHPCAVGVHLDGKIWYPSLLSSYAALAALACRKPVKLFLTREEDIRFSPKRPPSIIRHRAAIGAEGQLLALEARSVVDVGASAPFAEETLDRLCLGALGAYRCRNVRVEGFAVRTNTPPSGPFAGFGLAQAFFAVERHASHIAEACGIDPEDWRKSNSFEKHDRLPTGYALKDDVPSAALIDTVVSMSDYRRKWSAYELLKRGRTSRKEEPLRGIGVSYAYQGNGFLNNGPLHGVFSVEATLEKDGSLEIRTSAVSGSRETAALWRRVAAESLAMEPSDVRIASNRTDRSPDSGPSSLSRNVSVVTKLIERCCAAIRKQRFRDPLPITVKRSARNARGFGWDGRNSDNSPFGLFSWGAAVVEVEIDPVLYVPEIRGIWLCVDGGKILSERKARTSLENAVVHALGWASCERIEPSDGAFASGEPSRYDLATAASVPPIKIDFLWTDSAVPKGIGELPFSCVPAAFAQAVSQAAGASFDTIPLDPRSIRDALEGS